MSQASPIKRRKSRQIMVGTVPVGGDAPISVQSMTNTETRDVDATLAQINAIAEAGADIVRVSVPSMDAAEAFKLIRQQSPVPLVADIHFDHKIALKVAEYGVDCLRINPGNIGKEQKVREVIAACKDKEIPIRIGVNAGSLGKELMRKYPEPTSEALIESALKNVDILDYISNHNSLRPKLVVGFAAETNDLENYANKKLNEKNCDWIVANDVSNESIGFDADFNEVSILYKDKEIDRLEYKSKSEISDELVQRVIDHLK